MTFFIVGVVLYLTQYGMENYYSTRQVLSDLLKGQVDEYLNQGEKRGGGKVASFLLQVQEKVCILQTELKIFFIFKNMVKYFQVVEKVRILQTVFKIAVLR